MTELEFITTPDIWPQWPICPVVSRKDKWNDPAGFVIPNHSTVYIGNIFNLPSGSIADVINTLEKWEYPTFEKLLEDWKVD